MPPLLWLQIRDWNWSSQNTCSPLSGPAESSLLFLLPFETFLSRRHRRPARARWLSSADLVEAGCSRSATWISPSILTTMLPNLLWYPIGCLTWGNLQLWLCKRSSGGNTWLSPQSFRSSEDPDHSEWSLRQDGFYNTSAVFLISDSSDLSIVVFNKYKRKPAVFWEREVNVQQQVCEKSWWDKLCSYISSFIIFFKCFVFYIMFLQKGLKGQNPRQEETRKQEVGSNKAESTEEENKMLVDKN